MRKTALRRDVLRNAIGAATLSVVPVGRSRGGAVERRFTPERHGFGFRNWSTRRQDFESPAPVADPIGEYIIREWTPSAERHLGIDAGRADALHELLTTHLRSAIAQRAGTNGHCYGMSLAAQAYFEAPETLPLDRSSAAEIQHPTEPLSADDAPIYHDIVQLQAEQFLRFRTWLGRRALLWPHRVEMEAQLDDIRSVIDVFGTAQVSLFDSRSSGHQVLAYDYDDHRDGVTLYVYDPNVRAGVYEHDTRTIEFKATADGMRMEPYRKYDLLLFNRYDRIENATGRTTATPLDHFDLDTAEVREAIFPTALVTVDTADVDLTVVSPSDERFGRLGGEFMDRSRGDISRLRTAYGVDSGEYRISLYGYRSTSYELDVRIADPNGSRLSITHTDQIEADEAHVYAARMAETVDETGSFVRVERKSSRLPTAAGVLGSGVLLGAGAHYLWREHTRESSSNGDE